MQTFSPVKISLSPLFSPLLSHPIFFHNTGGESNRWNDRERRKGGNLCITRKRQTRQEKEDGSNDNTRTDSRIMFPVMCNIHSNIYNIYSSQFLERKKLLQIKRNGNKRTKMGRKDIYIYEISERINREENEK